MRKRTRDSFDAQDLLKASAHFGLLLVHDVFCNCTVSLWGSANKLIAQKSASHNT